MDREARQFEDSRHKFELVRTMDIPAIDVNDAVPIEKESAPLHRKPAHPLLAARFVFPGLMYSPQTYTGPTAVLIDELDAGLPEHKFYSF